MIYGPYNMDMNHIIWFIFYDFYKWLQDKNKRLKLIKVKFGSNIPINCNSWDDVIDQLGIIDSKELQFCIESKKNLSGMVRRLNTIWIVGWPKWEISNKVKILSDDVSNVT